MKESKPLRHTPGPLHVVKTGERFEVTNAEGDVLAECFGDDDDPLCWPVAANAALFASAPNLLEALRLLLDGAQAAQKEGLNQPQVNGGVILARAAIARAEGKTV